MRRSVGAVAAVALVTALVIVGFQEEWDAFAGFAAGSFVGGLVLWGFARRRVVSADADRTTSEGPGATASPSAAPAAANGESEASTASGSGDDAVVAREQLARCQHQLVLLRRQLADGRATLSSMAGLEAELIDAQRRAASLERQLEELRRPLAAPEPASPDDSD